MIGKRLAHYEVTALLGQGGMGEVYRATDTQLGRDVALKILPAAFAADPERIARFEREARTLASLQHPDIAAIHGLEADGDTRFLVMELCEGRNLAEVIAAGALPAAEAVRIAGRIAGGLEAAHEKGIVHRDLKPANIILTDDRWVKILDFGLARAFGGEPGADGEIANSPTLTAAFTQPGVILGTAGYMSPEQARGHDVDRRADIWAFGVILDEMLTGQRLFHGDTMTDTLAAVLTREIDLDQLPADTPPAVRHVLARCLERDPKKRLRDVGEARLLLSDPDASSLIMAPPPALGDVAAPRRPARSLLTAVPWLLVLVLAAVAGLNLGGGSGDEAPRPVRRFEIQSNLPRVYNSRAVDIAPDASRIAIFNGEGLFVRDLDNVQPRLLVPGDELSKNETGITPFWSPDSRFIAYGSRGRLWKVQADGGTPQVVCTLPGDWMGGCWLDDGTIVFSTGRGPMYTVDARGGEPVELLAPTPDVEMDFHQPSALPATAGGGFVYAVHRVEGVDTIELQRDGVRTILYRNETRVTENVQIVNCPVYSPSGHIVYQRDQGSRGLWALPFDAAQGVATGEPFLVMAEVGHPSLARDGTLVYMPMVFIAPRRLVEVDRDGEVVARLTEPEVGLSDPAVSADGKRILYKVGLGQGSDIYLFDRRTGIANRLAADTGLASHPTWIPGTDRFAFTGSGQDCASIYARNADGSDQPVILAVSGQDPTFTPDGRELIYTSMCAKERGLKRLVLGEGDDGDFIRSNPAGIDYSTMSPDGRFLGYLTWESGEPSLEIAQYPDVENRWLLANSESEIVWSHDGREVFYVTREPYMLIAVEVAPGPAFTVAGTTKLFEVTSRGIDPYARFDVAPDGRTFFFAAADHGIGTAKTFTVVENWYEEFRTD